MTTPSHAHASDRKLTEEEIQELREKVKAFMAEHVYPNEPFFHEHHPRRSPEGMGRMKELQAKTKAMGMWAPHLPSEAGGMGIGFMPYVYMNEILGRSPFAPMAFGSQAPDSGNAEILWQFGTKELQEKYMKPLVNGDIYSCYSMTEPEVSGADPTNLQTVARRDGDEWVINGHKWFTSQGEGATFAIVMCASELDQPPHRRMTQIVVPCDTPGFELIRPVPVMGETDGSHAEIRYNDVRVPITNTLGEAGGGFRIAQKRLGPGRIHHCMRLIGKAERALDLMCRRVRERVAFGRPIGEQTVTLERVAESRIDIDQARLLVLRAAWMMDTVGNKAARKEIAMIKVAAPAMALRVLDRAIQAFGAAGLSADFPLAAFYADSRTLRFADGPDEVHRNQIGRLELRDH